MTIKSYDESVEIHHIPNWPYTPDHHYRILFIGGSGSGKTNVFMNRSHKKEHSLKTWVAKLWFLLISMAHRVHNKTRKQGKIQRRLHCFWPGWLFWWWLKWGQKTDWKKKIVTKYWLKLGLMLTFSMNFLRPIWKNNVPDICIPF